MTEELRASNERGFVGTAGLVVRVAVVVRVHLAGEVATLVADPEALQRQLASGQLLVPPKRELQIPVRPWPPLQRAS